MPSVLHQALRRLFELDPALALALLGVLGVDVTGVQIEGTFDAGASVPQLEADACLRLRRADGALWILVIEVQLQIDDAKKRSWAVYETEAGRRAGADASVLVLTLDASVAGWAREPLCVGPSGSRFVPLVVHAAELPVVHDLGAAAALPGLVVLSALGHKGDASLALATATALEQLPAEDERLYLDVLDAELDRAAQRALEVVMQTWWRPMGEFAKKHWGEGHEAGRQEALVSSLFIVLRGRDLTPTPAEEARIRAAAIPELERWIAAAVTAGSVGEALA